jgi:hypothetical protein
VGTLIAALAVLLGLTFLVGAVAEPAGAVRPDEVDEVDCDKAENKLAPVCVNVVVEVGGDPNPRPCFGCSSPFPRDPTDPGPILDGGVPGGGGGGGCAGRAGSAAGPCGPPPPAPPASYPRDPFPPSKRCEVHTGFSANHRALDVGYRGVGYGDAVVAMEAGTVLGFHTDGGREMANAVIVRTGNHLTIYAHVRAFGIRPGVRVRQGQRIGRIDASGPTTGPHVHLVRLKAANGESHDDAFDRADGAGERFSLPSCND